MLTKIFIKIAVASALVAGAFSKPLPLDRDILARTDLSFNNWHGISSLSGFDNFYGSDNFDGFSHSVSQTIVEHDSELVCHSLSVEIIQQRLLVLQEMAKRIITEQICEVETQTIVFQQFHSSVGHFSDDLLRHSGRQVGFDRGIASHFSSIVEQDSSLSVDDFGFSGHDFGSQFVVPTGNNWNDEFSPVSVGSAFQATQFASSSSSSSFGFF
ncbi:hypothetical protein BDQ17DRAFT_1306155 [Cyathus striatus]|nr:hypothetical protein BDQ17DRAFT_1306155 [Cyathus striatus]